MSSFLLTRPDKNIAPSAMVAITQTAKTTKNSMFALLVYFNHERTAPTAVTSAITAKSISFTKITSNVEKVNLTKF